MCLKKHTDSVAEKTIQAMSGYTTKQQKNEMECIPSAQPTQCNSSNVLRHPQCAKRTKLGNCDPVGGFCTSVPKEICDAQVHDVLNDTDIVSRQKAIDTVHRMREIWDTGDIDDLEEMIVTALEELCPPQRIGKWLPEYGNPSARAHYCSACNFYYTTYPEEMNYCPHCGAYMVTEEEM